ncbi:hypothetical protein H9L19_06215 [Weissella diestrammenae]|uniref:Uncharacterized protein n=1 Tax=Weissella diestrammenae TaxID=1162633 RepID=A0A7G9T4F5_9LACO|nr:hypothetical protein [Weissella diestrammenae]MCM0583516.1 hypothetical protein [Weissella diestrammenae]QNN74980.1 hypothetical protein H9L19_06215 [Weissella diestrammenae]
MTVFGILLLLIALVTSIVLAVKLNKNKVKKVNDMNKQDKRTLTIALIFLIIGILFVSIDSSNSNKSATKPSINKREKVSDRQIISKFNELIANHLSEDQGFATGKLDENGKALPEGETREPNTNFAWSTTINKIAYYDAGGTNGIKIYLTADAANVLNKPGILAVAKQAQFAAASQIFIDYRLVNFFDLSTKDNPSLPFSVVCDQSGKEIGRSSALDKSLTLDSFK